VCLVISKDTKEGKDTKELPTLIVGDTLFAGSIGRTDLPGGDMETLLRSIREVLFSFPDDCVVWSGHGEPTTIGREKRTNPFLV
jgi:glyoxylase-like metal-dependent hydrolase (beta-lactamase superfamily II)